MGTPPLDQASGCFIYGPRLDTASSDNVITLWPQNPANQLEIEPPPFKRPKYSDDAPLNPLQNTPPISTMLPPPNPKTIHPPNPPIRGTNYLFFKTRFCQKFKTRSCPWGSNCNFAHGLEELRQPPPNWQELLAEERAYGSDQQRMHKSKICRKFYNGEVCPYGDRCTYLHAERESSGMAVGSIAGPEQVVGNGSGSHHSDSSGAFSSAGDCNGSNQKSKTRICYKWETTGNCSFGERCIFAHRHPEKKSERHLELDNGKIGVAPSKPLSNPTNDVPPLKTESTCMQQAQKKKSAFPNLSKKLSCIYADWIDDVPLFSRTT